MLRGNSLIITQLSEDILRSKVLMHIQSWHAGACTAHWFDWSQGYAAIFRPLDVWEGVSSHSDGVGIATHEPCGEVLSDALSSAWCRGSLSVPYLFRSMLFLEHPRCPSVVNLARSLPVLLCTKSKTYITLSQEVGLCKMLLPQIWIGSGVTFGSCAC